MNLLFADLLQLKYLKKITIRKFHAFIFQKKKHRCLAACARKWLRTKSLIIGLRTKRSLKSCVAVFTTRAITNSWVEEKQSAIILDRVGNANNLGAIVRSAAFFGIKNIVIPLDEAQSSVTTSSYRVAEGGMEFVNIYSVKSISYLLKDMEGKMVRFGTSLNAKRTVSQMSSLKGNKGAIVVLGNEEQGISHEVEENCDYLVIIPYWGMSEGKASAVDSLNVAQASSVIMYELSK